jgi:hypothetical protein
MLPILCLQWSSSKLGCCYYSESELFAMQDLWEYNTFGYVRTRMLLLTYIRDTLPNTCQKKKVIAQIEPQIVIIPDSSDDLLYEAIVDYSKNCINSKRYKKMAYVYY